MDNFIIIENSWQPWKDYKKELELLPIRRPPCEFCKNWKPVRLYRGSEFDGVRCCHSGSMSSDFSCFKPKSVEDYE